MEWSGALPKEQAQLQQRGTRLSHPPLYQLNGPESAADAQPLFSSPRPLCSPIVRPPSLPSKLATPAYSPPVHGSSPLASLQPNSGSFQQAILTTTTHAPFQPAPPADRGVAELSVSIGTPSKPPHFDAWGVWREPNEPGPFYCPVQDAEAQEWVPKPICPAEEVERLYAIYNSKPDALITLFVGQMTFLSQSCQAILSLCGLGLAVTGFSGGVIIRSGSLASAFLVGGIVFMAASAGAALTSIALFKWITQWLHPDVRIMARSCIRDRTEFKKWVAMSTLLLSIGLLFYLSSVSIAALANSGNIRES